ncbi:Salicylate biosynthesis isochorismate synthase [Paraliobacillus sp. PM-2]|uniref:isochorismate synthase n=1 Tax=Paraliobacillus sp. PM-2 TaxID=1462524 RepID=UPI00061C279D|nr:isochorismate synthase [Paraliobacillus sp. PM-2]CQR48208.1 Salicylate biosynthesis isochorismate synthase [Paraliobacillus sp. PM-2]
MIELKEKTFKILLNEAYQTVREDTTTRLISVTERIDPVNPLVVFERAKDVGNNRFFWSSVAEDFYLVGVGESLSFQATDDVYDQVEKQWKEIINKAIIYNEYIQPGTGPVAFGGFPFDSQEQLKEVWKDFNGSQFRIPTYLVVRNKDAYYLTINLILHPNDQMDELYEQVEKDTDELLSALLLDQTQALMDRKEEKDPSHWMELVQKATNKIKQGKAAKIVLAREMDIYFQSKPIITLALQQLVETQSSSFVFAYEQEESCFIGATPERLVRVEQEQLFSACLAGTAPRGKTLAEDQRIATNLLDDHKNREEHDYVVQMIKEAVSNACTAVAIPDKPIIYPLESLQHLYTPVTAKLKSNYTILDIVKCLHPTPALGGLPREASMAFIQAFEPIERGWYGAPIGWFDTYQNGEFAVAIRSGLIRNKRATLFAGCGVVKESSPVDEYEETLIKFAPMLDALGVDNE